MGPNHPRRYGCMKECLRPHVPVKAAEKEVSQFCVPEILRCFGSRRSHARSSKQRIPGGDNMYIREPFSSFSYNASRFVVPHRQLCTSTEVYCSRTGMPTCAISSMPSRNMQMSEFGCYSEKEVEKERTSKLQNTRIIYKLCLKFHDTEV